VLPAPFGVAVAEGVRGVGSPVRALINTRSTLRLLIERDLKARYSEDRLGYFWTVLEPLLMAVVYWFVFSVIMSRSVGATPYIVFLLVGQLYWQWASGAIRQSSKAIKGESRLVRSTNLPRELWVLRVVGTETVEFVMAIPVLVLFMAMFWGGLDLDPLLLLFFPVAMALTVVLTTGIGFFMASVAVLFPDVTKVVRIILQVGFYLSPVLYGVHDVDERLPDAWQWVYSLNPMVGIIDLARAGIFPNEFTGWLAPGISVVMSVAILVLGTRIFRRLENDVLKEI
jgi:ABC-2 type transport system permease protein